jgi:2-methylaconitate cis-trans-isomerase PrpF
MVGQIFAAGLGRVEFSGDDGHRDKVLQPLLGGKPDYVEVRGLGETSRWTSQAVHG